MSKPWIRISGYVRLQDNSVENWHDQFIDWLEANEWSFIGVTTATAEEELEGSAASIELTAHQRAVLAAIRWLTEERGIPPTVREIGKAVGLSSASTVHGHLQRLKAKGCINWQPGKPRTIRPLVPA